MSRALLPPNSTPLELALGDAIGRVADIPTPIRDIHDPDLCSPAMLPWLAWARSVDVWSSDWSVDVRRATVAESFKVHRIKGTRAAVERAFQALSITVDITEWHQTEPKGAPYTFEAIVWVGRHLFEPESGAVIMDARLNAQALAIIDQTKPVRAHFTYKLGVRFDRALGVGVASSVTALARPSARPSPELKTSFSVGAILAAAPMQVCRTTMQGSLAA